MIDLAISIRNLSKTYPVTNLNSSLCNTEKKLS